MLIVGELAARLSLDRKGFEKGLEDARSGLEGLSAGMLRTGGILSAAITAPLAALGTRSVQLFAEQEQAEASLAEAIRRSGGAAEEALKSLKDYAAQIQATTLYGDEAVLKGMALAANLGVQQQDLQKAAKAAVGLAAAYGMDLQTAFMLVGKAAAGNTTVLARYGIQLDENATAEEKFQQLLELGAGKFGAAEAAAGTATGKLQQLHMAIGDMMESFGAVLADGLTPLANGLKVVANAIGALPAPVRTTIVVLGALAAAIGPVLIGFSMLIKAWLTISALAPALGAAWTVAMGPIGWVLAGIAALAAGVFLVIKNWGKIKGFFGNLWDGVKAGLAELAKFFQFIWQGIYNMTIGRFVAMFGIIKRFAEMVFRAGRDLVTGRGVDLEAAARYVVSGEGGEQAQLLREIRDLNARQLDAAKPLPATRIT